MNTENEKTAVSAITAEDPKVRYYLNATVDDAMECALEFKKDLGDLAKGLIELEKRIPIMGWVELYGANKYNLETSMIYTQSAIKIANHLMPLLGKRIGTRAYSDLYLHLRDRILLIAYIHKGIKLAVVGAKDTIREVFGGMGMHSGVADNFSAEYDRASNAFIHYAEQLRIDGIILGVNDGY